MSDLISRKALLEILCKHYVDCEKAYERTKGRAWEHMMLAYSRAIGEVRAMETAYDIDEVVKRIKEPAYDSRTWNRESGAFDLRMIEEDKTIEIVKGAVNDE